MIDTQRHYAYADICQRFFALLRDGLLRAMATDARYERRYDYTHMLILMLLILSLRRYCFTRRQQILLIVAFFFFFAFPPRCAMAIEWMICYAVIRASPPFMT